MDRWQQVVLKEAASNCRKFTSRDPQKSVLGSIFFLRSRHKEKYETYSFHLGRKQSHYKKGSLVFFYYIKYPYQNILYTHKKYGIIFFYNKKNIHAIHRPESEALSEILYTVSVSWSQENMLKLESLQRGATAMAGRLESHRSGRRVKCFAAFVWLSKKLKGDMADVYKWIYQTPGWKTAI